MTTYPLPSNVAQYIDAMGRPTPDYYRWLKQVDRFGTGNASGLPTGGTTGQILEKASATDGDAIWHTLVKGDVGLGNVDNTSDLGKPISTATQTALDLKADIADLGAYQPLDSDLTAIAALASTGIARRTAPNTWSVGTLVTYSEIQNVTNNRILGNVSGAAAAPSELTGAQVASLFTAATQQVLLSGSGTYTAPSNVKFLRVRLVGGGGGGAPGNALTTAATAGGNTTFSTLTANGGSPGISTGGGSGGGASGGNVNLAGGTGQNGVLLANSPGGHGGISPLGRGGWGGSATNPGTAAKANSGSGGGGGGSAGATLAGGGGGSGGYVETIIASPAATYSYSVGAGGAGAVGTINGGAGGSGLIIIDEFYS